MPDSAFPVGSKVIFNPDIEEIDAKYCGVIYAVTEVVTPAKIVVLAQSSTRGLKVDPKYLLALPDDGIAPLKNIPVYPPLAVGAVVTIALQPSWKDTTGFYVVLLDKGDVCRIAKLGGDSNKYWPKARRSLMTEVDPRQVLDALAGLKPPASS